MTHRSAPFLHYLMLAPLLACASFALAADRPNQESAGTRSQVPAAAKPDAAPSAQPSEPLSAALRIARLDRSLESDAARLAELKADLDRPDSEYSAAEAEFDEIDGQLLQKKQEIESRAKTIGAKPDRKLQNEVAALEKTWALARDRFDLTIRQRKAIQESITALEEKIKRDRQALDGLRGADTADPAGTQPAAPDSAERPRGAGAPESETPGAAVPHSQSTITLSPTQATKPAADVAQATEAAKGSGQAAEVVPAELAAASAAAETTRAAADAAEHEAHSISQRMEILQKNIDLARQLRDTAHKKVDNADETLKSLNEELFRKLLAGANADALKEQIHEATVRVREARDESRQASVELDKLQSTLAALQAEQLAANREAEQRRKTASQAAAVVKELNNPFAVHRLLQWALDHGPKILAILLAVAVCLRLSRTAEARLVSLIARRAGIGNREERENRAKTLLGIFHNAANIVILGGGAVAVLDEVGIPVAPLIGGAAVIGLAVAFGAQSLIKDYFTGFLVLLEHQYLVNDVVKIGAIAGQVERITLRTTMLRDGEGHVHFIPHGQITTVTNTTHGWSRAVFEIRIGYRENVDRVIEILSSLAKEFRASPDYAGMILDDPVMLGVEALAESAVILKFHIKTRPLHQGAVRRELLRRIKNRLDELGIEIPSPQLTIHRPGGGSFGIVVDERDRRAS